MLARFERLIEHAVEGSLRRVFKTTLQPVQVAKAAARAMEDAQVIGLAGIEVPNVYNVHLAPADFDHIGDYSARLTAELSRYLTEYARERGLRPVAEPEVGLVRDAAQAVGRVRVETHFAHLEPARQAALEQAVDGTRRLRLADLAAAGTLDARTEGPEAELWLEDNLGLRVPLEREAGIVRLGRAVDNDAAIANQRVSRYHAQLRWVESAWLAYDLDSTNGTFVDGERVLPSSPRPLRAGSVLRLGDHDLRVAPAQ
ncbi:MAG: DUF3662 and FHA domain-containing protein [Chloroflexi bacterium]|nr:DUF3662 and FHA domain-containing protein [Chloroflexota bacterium]